MTRIVGGVAATCCGMATGGRHREARPEMASKIFGAARAE